MIGRAEIDDLRRRFDLDETEAAAVLALMQLFGQTCEQTKLELARADLDEQGVDEAISEIVSGATQSGRFALDERTVWALLGCLAEAVVATAFAFESDLGADYGAIALGAFADWAASVAPQEAQPAVGWLRALAFERLGDVELAEAALLAPEFADSSWPPALLWMAHYAFDRGEVRRAQELIERSGETPDSLGLKELLAELAGNRTGVGRNDPCWCGAPRKYKQCHLHPERLPLDERADWLYHKAELHLRNSRQPLELLLEVAEARSGPGGTQDAFERACAEPLVSDVVLFEGGVFEDFLAARGALLPDDERSLAEQWLLTERSVHEVIAVQPGQGVTLRDIRTGDINEVRERLGSTQMLVGQFYCARVSPAGASMQVFGGWESVPWASREQLISVLDDEPDPVELVEELSLRLAPPTLVNTDGDALMECSTTMRTADPEGLAIVLDETFGPRARLPKDAVSWAYCDENQGLNVVKARLTLRGGTLEIRANSSARIERARSTIQALDPTATVIESTSTPMDATYFAQHPPPDTPVTIPVENLSASGKTALKGFMRQFETSWLDEPIPALNGLTPRQCAADPTRRPDLIQLLNSIPPTTPMDVDWLRAELGLE